LRSPRRTAILFRSSVPGRKEISAVTNKVVHVGLLATCLVDLMRPSVGFAAAKLLRAAGCLVSVPATQTCCGQPAHNGGDRKSARALARNVIEAFEGFDYVVVPSGSCAAMVCRHYPGLFDDDAAMAARAEAMAARTFELTAFLVDVLDAGPCAKTYGGTVAYHDSCSALRELGIRRQPRLLLGALDGPALREAEDAEACCGFGGTFCVKYDEISDAMVTKKIHALAASGADTVASTDLGCLLQIAGKLGRAGATMRVRHIAELLAGTDTGPAIGEAGGGPDED
jgi:L-lactate dehydrogenase complex protein LldE